MSELFSWVVTIVGCVGFILAGKQIWWAWYVNIANQIAWVVFALVSGYEAFLLGTVFYLIVFVRNAYLWTKRHMDADPKRMRENFYRSLLPGQIFQDPPIQGQSYIWTGKRKIPADGRTVPREEFPELWLALKDSYNTSSTKDDEFRIPDLRPRSPVPPQLTKE